MTTKPSATPTHPLDALEGVEIIFLAPLTAFDRVQLRGESRVLSASDIESTIDRLGNSWLSTLDDIDAQQRAWHVHAFTRAEALTQPVTPWRDRNDPLFHEAREAARQAAWKIVDDAERAAAFQKLDADFGAAPTTSTVLSSVNPDARDRAAWR